LSNIDRSQILETTNSKPVGSVVVVGGVNASRIEVQIECVSTGNTGRPVVAVPALIVEAAIAVVAVTGSAKIITMFLAQD
jgi:hypothetical protein